MKLHPLLFENISLLFFYLCIYAFMHLFVYFFDGKLEHLIFFCGVLKSFVLSFYLQAGPIIEAILCGFPDYIKVKDLPQDDTDFKVTFCLISLLFACHYL